MHGQDNGLFLVSGFLNAEDNVAQGGVAGLGGVPGELGKIIALSDAAALKLSKTATGTLYNGIYQKVQFKAGSTAANIRGGAVFWIDRANFIVTPDATAVTEDDFAGIGLMVNTKGSFGVMQAAGKCSVLYRAAVTDKTNGNLVLQLTTTNTFDAIADATGTYVSGGVKGIKNVVGVALETPGDGVVKLVSIWPRNMNYRG